MGRKLSNLITSSTLEQEEQNKLEFVMRIQSYIDNTFRLVIFIYSLALALLAFSKGKPVLVILTTLIITMVIIYALFVLITLGPLVLRFKQYNRFHLVFYYIETVLLIAVFFAVMYYFVAPFRDTENSKEISEEAAESTPEHLAEMAGDENMHAQYEFIPLSPPRAR